MLTNIKRREALVFQGLADKLGNFLDFGGCYWRGAWRAKTPCSTNLLSFQATAWVRENVILGHSHFNMDA
jgi:hypothetical protein